VECLVEWQRSRMIPSPNLSFCPAACHRMARAVSAHRSEAEGYQQRMAFTEKAFIGKAFNSTGRIQ